MCFYRKYSIPNPGSVGLELWPGRDLEQWSPCVIFWEHVRNVLLGSTPDVLIQHPGIWDSALHASYDSRWNWFYAVVCNVDSRVPSYTACFIWLQTILVFSTVCILGSEGSVIHCLWLQMNLVFSTVCILGSQGTVRWPCWSRVTGNPSCPLAIPHCSLGPQTTRNPLLLVISSLS